MSTEHGRGSLQRAGVAADLTQSRLWVPQAPSHENLTISTLEPICEYSSLEPLVNIDFGGSHGILLLFLKRIVVHMGSDRCPIIGMEFFYTGRSVKFGSGGGTEMSFLIDGPGGERVTGMEVTVHDPDCTTGLQV